VTGDAGAVLRQLRRTARRHRSALAALLAAGAVASGLAAISPTPARHVAVLVAARDIAAGHVLGARDVVAEELPPSTVPDGALRPGDRVAGRLAAGALRRGEPLTDARLAGPGLLTGSAARDAAEVAAPVRIADAGAAALLSPGDRVDVLATPPDGAGATTVVAANVVVLAVPRADPAVDDGALIVVATTGSEAAGLARAAVGDRLSVTVHGSQ
jgi:Flp pilus assembly protein CpaB